MKNNYRIVSSVFLILTIFSMTAYSPGGGAAGLLPDLTVSDSGISEGDSGPSNLTFDISLSAATATDVAVDYTTVDDTANAGRDYLATSGTLTIPAGSTTATITVWIKGDTRAEDDELVTLTLTNPINASLAISSANGTILNDDFIPAAPIASLSIIPPKAIQLSWDAVPDATYYRVLKNPDGISGLNIIAENLTELEYTDMVAVHLHVWSNAIYRVAACNASGCARSLALQTLGQSAAAIGYFKASNTETQDLFGGSLALSGDGFTLAVAASAEDSNATGVNGDQTNNSTLGSGAVYVFRQEAGLWVQKDYIKASNAEVQDSFGKGIALNYDGTILAATTFTEDSNATGINGDESNNSASRAGAAYLFRYDGNIWIQDAYIKASNTDVDDFFGFSVALSDDGNTLAIGAVYEGSNATGINGDETDNSAFEAGAVYVFSYDGINWAQQAYIKASNTDAGDQFGYAIALSGDGNLLAVSADGEESNATGIDGDQFNNTAGDAGAVYVFSRIGSTWLQQSYIKAANTEQDDDFGDALALSANGLVLAVSAIHEDSSATGINGDMSDNSASSAGAVYIYYFDGSAWQTGVYLKASNTEPGDYFGESIGLNTTGDMLVVGAMLEDSLAIGTNGNQSDNGANNAGAAYVFTRIGAVWSQQSYLKAPNTDANDFFGSAVSISAEGDSLVISGTLEESAATGINGDQTDNSAVDSGAAYLY